MGSHKLRLATIKGYISVAVAGSPSHRDFPPCPDCGWNQTWPDGVCRVCAERARVAAELEGSEEGRALLLQRERSVGRFGGGRI